LGEGALAPQPIILTRTATLPIQFVQVLTNFWYSHTYSFVALKS
jgi:hypothetical protein